MRAAVARRRILARRRSAIPRRRVHRAEADSGLALAAGLTRRRAGLPGAKRRTGAIRKHTAEHRNATDGGACPKRCSRCLFASVLQDASIIRLSALHFCSPNAAQPEGSGSRY